MNDSDSQSALINWSNAEVLRWAQQRENLSDTVMECLQKEEIDGHTILTLTENDIRDFRYKLDYNIKFCDMKKLWSAIRTLQNENTDLLRQLGLYNCDCVAFQHPALSSNHNNYAHAISGGDLMQLNDVERISPPLSIDGRATNVPPEIFKTFISVGYSFLVTWITSFVMVIVHERVPDMKRYPPLPDIFLDNVPHIPWAFHMCEITGTLLFTIWSVVCVFHKYRMVLLRRFFGIAGTVFLLRCVTMLITSLSVPGTHLQCNQNDYKVDDTNLTMTEAVGLRISRAYAIWSGLGMSIQGVRTCGDYMFSGHTVALTLLNFFITEYTPRNLYFLHTLTWLLNMFGIFFILAAHEHYSIDVFVAFYITSRLFLYYHTLANNQALMSHDSNRTRIWFPMFSYFECSVDGIIPNEYDSVGTILSKCFVLITCLKDSCMLTARRFWITPYHLQPSSNKSYVSLVSPNNNSSKETNSLVPSPQSAQPSNSSSASRNSSLSSNNQVQKQKNNAYLKPQNISDNTETTTTLPINTTLVNNFNLFNNDIRDDLVVRKLLFNIKDANKKDL